MDSTVGPDAHDAERSSFEELFALYRPELHVHCYRMLGSFDDAEDLVQQTFLRGWQHRAGYTERSAVRAWLYRIATNACLDFLARQRRALPQALVPSTGDSLESVPPVAISWLQPYPDSVLANVSSHAPGPDDVAIARETIELAFLVAIQQLQPRQRAVLILRDVLGWSARETAAVLESSVASVNSVLQRARPRLRQHLPRRRLEWARSTEPTDEERAVLRRYMEAIERADDRALARLLRDDARVGHRPGAGGHAAPTPTWYSGRAAILAAWAPALHGPEALQFRMVETWANRQPAAASYVRRLDEDAEYRAFGLAILRIEDGLVADVSVFAPDAFPAFGLPASLK